MIRGGFVDRSNRWCGGWRFVHSSLCYRRILFINEVCSHATSYRSDSLQLSSETHPPFPHPLLPLLIDPYVTRAIVGFLLEVICCCSCDYIVRPLSPFSEGSPRSHRPSLSLIWCFRHCPDLVTGPHIIMPAKQVQDALPSHGHASCHPTLLA